MSATNGAFFTEQFLKPNGDPAAGVRVFHYVAGNTVTNLDVYQNGDLTAPHNNPVVGDAVGRVSFYGNGTYRLLVKTAQDDPEYPNTTLYDWDPVELVHHTATLRAEDRGLSLPSASAASRGRLFGTVDGGGDITNLYVQQTASAWASLLSGGLLTNILQYAKGTTIASTTSVTVPNDGNFFDVTGTNAIESMTGFVGYPVIFLRTISPLTFVHHPTNLRLLGSANRTTLAEQVTAFLHLGAGQWMELWYTNPFWGDGSLVDGSVLVGNAQGAITELGLPTVDRVLGHSGVTASDPSWLTGLLYHGPTSVVAGSTRSHEGNVTISSNQALSGTHVYTTFTLNAGATITTPTGTRAVRLYASDSITINGQIDSRFSGGAGGTNGGSGGPGTDQPGGTSTSSGAGGAALVHGAQLAGSGTQVTASVLALLLDPATAMGSGGGGSGDANSPGGTGGGSIVLCAPRIILGSTAAFNTSGQAGSTSAAGNAGGGGAGNIYMRARSITNNGATFTQNGGAGVGTGVAGSNGVAQMSQYG